jgi:hypothetical protein
VAIANALIGAKDIDYLGVKPNLKSSPMRIVQDLLRATLGFTLQSTQVKRDGKKIREYKFVGVGDKRYTIFEAWDKKTAEINEAMGVVPPFLYKDIEMVVPPELEETPPMNLAAPVPDIENLEGLILVEDATGRPDIVAKQSNYTTWITAKRAYISRNDVREGYYRPPNLNDVVGWMKTAIAEASPQKAKWLDDNFGHGSDCLMERAMNAFFYELAPIYDLLDAI